MSKQIMAKKSFSLVELLVVMAILVVLAGGVITQLGSSRTTAYQSQGSKDIAHLIASVNSYQALNNGLLPNNLDAIVANTVGTVNTELTYDDATGDLVSTAPHVESGTTAVTVPPFIIDYFAGQGAYASKGKVQVIDVPQAALGRLSAAGLTHARFLAMNTDNDDTTDTVADISALTMTYGGGSTAGAENLAFPTGKITEQDFPGRAYDAPRPKSGANRSRGFSKALIPTNPGTSAQLLQWKPGTLGYNNTKVGGSPNDFLLAFGIGNKSSLVSGDRPILEEAPVYGAAKPSEYPRYFALIKAGEDANGDGVFDDGEEVDAEFITVVDGRGEFLDEEISEATGQYSN